MSSLSSTVEIDGAVSTTGTVAISQNSATALTVNAAATGRRKRKRNRVRRDGNITNSGSGGISSRCRHGGQRDRQHRCERRFGKHNGNAAGNGGLSAPNILLAAAAGIGSVTGAVPITISGIGTSINLS